MCAKQSCKYCQAYMSALCHQNEMQQMGDYLLSTRQDPEHGRAPVRVHQEQSLSDGW